MTYCSDNKIYSLVKDLPEDTRNRVIRNIVPYYVQLLIHRASKATSPEESEKLLNKALALAEKAVDAGITAGGLPEIKEYLENLSTLSESLSIITSELAKLSKSVENVNTEILGKAIESARSALDKLRPRLDVEKARKIENLINTASDVLKAIPYLLRANKAVEELAEKSKEVSASTPGEAVERIREFNNLVRNTIRELEYALRGLNELKPVSDTAREYISRVTSSLKNIIDGLKTTLATGTSLEKMYANITSLTRLINEYGKGDSFLGNTAYREQVKRAIQNILSAVKSIESLLSRITDEHYRGVVDKAVESAVSYLNTLKRNLGMADVRWVEVFDEAEDAAGYQLVDVPKDIHTVLGNLKKFVEGRTSEYVDKVVERVRRALTMPSVAGFLAPILGVGSDIAARVIEETIKRAGLGWFIDLLDKAVRAGLAPGLAMYMLEPIINGFINDMREKGKLAYRYGDTIARMFGGMMLFTSGLVDALTTIIRPETLARQFQVVREMIRDPRLFASALAETLRSQEELLFFIGNLVGALLIARAAKTALGTAPEIVKDIIANILQGDPLGTGLAVIGSAPAKAAFTGVVLKYADKLIPEIMSSKTVSTLIDVASVFDEAARKTLGDMAEKTINALKRVVVEGITHGRKLSKVVSEAKKTLASIGAEELVDIRKKLAEIAEKARETAVIKTIIEEVSGRTRIPPVSIEETVAKLKTLVEGLSAKAGTLLELMKILEELKKHVGRAEAKTIDDLAKRIHKALESVSTVKMIDKLYSEAKRITEESLLRTLSSKLRAFMEKAEPEYIFSTARTLEDILRKHGLTELADTLRNAIRSGDVDTVRSTIKNVLAHVSAMAPRLGREAVAGLLEDMGSIAPRIYSNIVIDVASRIARVLDEHGLKNLADEIRYAVETGDPATVRARVLDVLRDIAKHVDEVDWKLLETIQNVVETLTKKDPVLSKLLGDIAYNIREAIELKMKKLTSLSDLVATELEKMIKTLTPETRTKVESVLKGLIADLRRGKITVEEVYRALDDISKIIPEIKVRSDLLKLKTSILALKDTLGKLLKQCVGATEFPEALERLMSKIDEVTGKIDAEIGRAMTLEVVSPSLKRGLLELASDIKKVDPEMGARFEQVINRFLSELEAGKFTKETYNMLVDLLKELREKGFIKKGLKTRLANTLSWARSRLAQLTGKGIDTETRKLVENLIVEIDKTIKSLPEVPDGYGIIVLKGVRRKAPLVMAEESILDKVKEILNSDKAFRFVVEENGLELRGYRRVYRLPDGTLKIVYHLETPDGKWMEIGIVNKPVSSVKPWSNYMKVDTLTYITFDPRGVEDAAFMNTLRNIYNVLKTADPDLRFLERVVLLTPSDVLVKLGDILARLGNTASVIAFTVSRALAQLDPRTALWYISLLEPKKELLDLLGKYMGDVPENVEAELERLGLIPIGYVEEIGGVIVTPTREIDLRELTRRITGYRDLLFKGVKLRFPLLNIAGLKLIIIPNISVKMTMPPLTLQKVNAKIEEELEGQTIELPETVLTVPKAPVIGIGAVAAREKKPTEQARTEKEKARGVQYEVLEI